jgi:DNA primase catalytic core
VNDLPLDQVISKYVELKNKGSQYTGKSPFVEEKSPSFQVSPSKGVWKCFSSGNGGNNGISFVMKVTNCTYVEAIKEIAEANGIIIDYDESDKGKAYLAKAEKVREITDINVLALEYFISHVESIPPKKLRATPAMYQKFSLGYAPNEWHGLLKFMLSKGVSQDQLLRSGLVAIKEGSTKSFDAFRGRIMFPIYSTSGKILGFSGREILSTTPEESKLAVKVINSKETDAYNKSDSLLGIFQSKSEIGKMGFATLVEGNFDVTSFHSVGLTNTIAPLGSAFTKEQATILRKFTDTVCLCVDNDKAGLEKIEKNATLLLELGFKVFLFIPELEGTDPDDLIQSKTWKGDEFVEFFNANKTDAVEYLAELFFKKSGTTIEKSNAENKLTKVLSMIADARLRNSYVKEFARVYKIDKSTVEQAVKTELTTRAGNDAPEESGKKHKLPTHLKDQEKEDWQEYNFYEDNYKEAIGYYFPTAQYGFERISNFVIKPLFQVESHSDSKRIVEITNKTTTKIIEVPNKVFVSAPMFEELVMNYGNFNFTGTKRQYQHIRSKLNEKFPFCREIRTLGWQKDGFFAFANGIVDGHWRKVDAYGICHYGEEKFFLPAFSKIYSESQEEDDFYEADRYFIYRPGGITMKQWATKMQRVHLENGMWTVLYAIAATFRDFIFSSLSYFPHLFLFGQVQTGKSTCARSLNSIWFGSQAAFNLSSGTAVGFHRRLARTKNAVVWFDEYTNDLDEKRFQPLKAAFDGAGHEKGIMSNDNRTIGTKINSAVAISGQYLPTRDDNSLFTRCIMLYFTRKAEETTEADIAEFNELKKWEQTGLSDLVVEMVKYRDHFVSEFDDTLFEIVSKMKNDLQGQDYKGRIMDIFAVMACSGKIMAEKLHLPFSFDDIYKKCLEAIVKQSEQVSDSDAMRSYWKMIEYLSFQHQIRIGEDYVVKTETQVQIREGRKDPRYIQFEEPTQVLYLRLTKIHPLYLEFYKKQHSETGVPEQSIKSYIKTTKGFIGNCPVINFEGSKTSAYAFVLDQLGLSLKGVNEEKEPDIQKATPPAPKMVEEVVDADLPF